MRYTTCITKALLLGGVLSLAACDLFGTQPREIILRDLSSVEREIVAADNTFGFNLLRALQAETPDETLFISPVSVSFALGMTLNGASGATYDAMAETLGKAGLTETEVNAAYQSLMELLTGLDPKVVLEIANSIWYREGFDVRPEFLDVNRTYFDAEVRALNFDDPAAPDVINGWVDEKTKGKIEEVIKEIGADVVMVLINAIYFKGDWAYRFDEDDTRDDTFTNADGSTTPVKMMRQHATLPMASTERYTALDLPYGDSLYSMTLVLPGEGVTVDDLVADLDADAWADLTGRLTPREVDVELPRFKIEYETSLEDALSALGMEVAFTDAADFSRIRESGGLKIDDVIHKTFVQVNEEGTEAAAVTAVVIVETSAPIPQVFRVDRPFVFAVRERHSGTVLFLGKVMSL